MTEVSLDTLNNEKSLEYSATNDVSISTNDITEISIDTLNNEKVNVMITLPDNDMDHSSVQENDFLNQKVDEKGYPIVKKVGGGGPEYPKFFPMLITIISILFFTILNESVASVMYADLTKEFNKEITTVQWVTTAFIIVLAIGMVLSAYLSKHLLLRTIFFVADGFFLIGSILCVVAPTFAVLIVARIFQAIGTSMLMPQITPVIMIMAPREHVGMYNGLTMVVAGSGAALGPTLSGVITNYLGWRYVFLILTPIPLIGGLCGIKTMGNVVKQEKTRIDFLSLILVFLGYGGISLGLGFAGDEGFTSWKVLVPLIIGILALPLLFLSFDRSKNPLINVKNMGNAYFILNIFYSASQSFFVLGLLAIFPFIIEHSLGKSVFISGISLLPGGIVNALMNIVAGKIYDKYRFKYSYIAYFFMLLSAIFMFLMFRYGHAELWVIILGYLIVSSLVPIIPTTFSTAALTSIPPQSTPHGGALFHSSYQLFGALGTAVYIAILKGCGSVSWVDSEDPFIRGGTMCLLLLIITMVFFFITSAIWCNYYFHKHPLKLETKKNMEKEKNMKEIKNEKNEKGKI